MEREVYNPDTGGYDLGYHPGIYGNAPVDDGFRDALNALYRQYYGRDATEDEYASHRGNPGGLPAIEQLLIESQPPVRIDNDPNPKSTPTPPTPPTTLPPPTTPPQTPTLPSGRGGFGYLTEPFTGTAPAWKPGPTYTAPTWEPPPAFRYTQFEAPTPESIYADPSYQFREGQGRQALQQAAGAKGVLRTGGTLKDLINYGQNAASQEYSNIYGRAVDAHNLGLQQELGTYALNYGVGKDQRDYLYDTSKAEFAPQQRENEQMNQRDFDSFLANFDVFERNRRRAGDYLTWAAEQGSA